MQSSSTHDNRTDKYIYLNPQVMDDAYFLLKHWLFENNFYLLTSKKETSNYSSTDHIIVLNLEESQQIQPHLKFVYKTPIYTAYVRIENFRQINPQYDQYAQNISLKPGSSIDIDTYGISNQKLMRSTSACFSSVNNASNQSFKNANDIIEKAFGVKQDSFEYLNLLGRTYFNDKEERENTENTGKNLIIGTASTKQLMQIAQIIAEWYCKRGYSIETQTQRSLVSFQTANTYSPIFCEKLFYSIKIRQIAAEKQLLFNFQFLPLSKISISKTEVDLLIFLCTFEYAEKDQYKQMTLEKGKRQIQTYHKQIQKRQAQKPLSSSQNKRNEVEGYMMKIMEQSLECQLVNFPFEAINPLQNYQIIIKNPKLNSLVKSISANEAAASFLSQIITFQQLSINVNSREDYYIQLTFSGLFKKQDKLMREVLDFLQLDAAQIALNIRSDSTFLIDFHQHLDLQLSLSFNKTIKFGNLIQLKNIFLYYSYFIGTIELPPRQQISMSLKMDLMFDKVVSFDALMRYSSGVFLVSAAALEVVYIPALKLSLEKVGCSISKSEKRIEVGIFGTIRSGQFEVEVYGQLQETNGKFELGALVEMPHFTFNDLKQIWRNYCNSSDSLDTYNISFNDVVMSIATVDCNVNKHSIKKGFMLRCNLSLPELDGFPTTIHAEAHISTDIIQFNAKIDTHFSLGPITIKSCQFQILFSNKAQNPRKHIQLGFDTSFWDTNFQALLQLEQFNGRWEYFLEGTLSSGAKKGGDLANLADYFAISSVSYKYASASKGEHRKGHTLTAYVTKLLKMDVDFSLSYSSETSRFTFSKQFNKEIGINHKQLSSSFSFSSLNIIVELKPSLFVGFSTEMVFNKFTIPLEIGIRLPDRIEVEAGIHVMDEEWKNPFGLCDMLKVAPNFFVMGNKIDFRLGMNFEGVPTLIEMKECMVRLNEDAGKDKAITIHGMFKADIEREIFIIDVEVQHFHFSTLIDSVYYLASKEHLQQETQQFVDIISVENIKLKMKLNLAELIDCSFDLKIIKFQLFKIFKANEISFSADRNHVAAKIDLDVIDWGILKITRFNQSEVKGALLDIQLSKSTFHCIVNGRVQLLGILNMATQIYIKKNLFYFNSEITFFNKFLQVMFYMYLKSDQFRVSFRAEYQKDINNKNKVHNEMLSSVGSQVKEVMEESAKQGEKKNLQPSTQNLKGSFNLKESSGAYKEHRRIYIKGQTQILSVIEELDRLMHKLQIKKQTMEHKGEILHLLENKSFKKIVADLISKEVQILSNFKNHLEKLYHCPHKDIKGLKFQSQQLQSIEKFFKQIILDKQLENNAIVHKYLNQQKNRILQISRRHEAELKSTKQVKLKSVSFLQFSFFDWMWNKVVSFYNYVKKAVDYAVEFCKTILSNLEFSLEQLIVGCDGMISAKNSSINFYMVFSFKFLGRLFTVKIGCEDRIDSELVKHDVSAKMTDHMLDNLAMKEMSLELQTIVFGRGGNKPYSTIIQNNKAVRILKMRIYGRLDIQRNQPFSEIIRCETIDYSINKNPTIHIIGEGEKGYKYPSFVHRRELSLNYNEEVEYVEVGLSQYFNSKGSIATIQVKPDNKELARMGLDHYSLKRVEIHGLLRGIKGTSGTYVDSLQFSYLREDIPAVSAKIALQKIGIYQKISKKYCSELIQNRKDSFKFEQLKFSELSMQLHKIKAFYRADQMLQNFHPKRLTKLKLYFINYQTQQTAYRYVREVKDFQMKEQNEMFNEVVLQWFDIVIKIKVYRVYIKGWVMTGLEFHFANAEKKPILIGVDNRDINNDQLIFSQQIILNSRLKDIAGSAYTNGIRSLSFLSEEPNQIHKLEVLTDSVDSTKWSFVCRHCQTTKLINFKCTPCGENICRDCLSILRSCVFKCSPRRLLHFTNAKGAEPCSKCQEQIIMGDCILICHTCQYRLCPKCI